MAAQARMKASAVGWQPRKQVSTPRRCRLQRAASRGRSCRLPSSTDAAGAENSSLTAKRRALVDQVKREASRVDAEGRPVGSANATNGTGAAASSGDPLLVVQNVSKHFGGTQALDQVGLEVSAGEIVALLGENGAGKSTLIKILASVYSLDQGSVSYRGRDATPSLRRLPIAFIHQDLGLIDWMTVAENICLTLGYPRRFGMVDWHAARRRAARGARHPRRRHRSGRAHPEPQPDREIAGGDRARAGGGGGDPRARRADRQPAGRRGGAALHGAPAAARPWRRDDLRLAPARRGVRDRRPDGGAARRSVAGERRVARRRRRRRSC